MRRIWAALLLLPTLAWAQSFDTDSFDSTNSFDTDSFDFAAPTVCTSDDASPTPGTTISITSCTAFAGTITTLTSPSGDTIPAQGGASTTAADFGIPAALVGFIASGSMQDTEWAVDGTWTVGDGTTTQNITLRIDPPGTSGPTHFFGTVVGPEAGDSVFPPAAAATDGDEYYVAVVSGTSVSVNANGSTSAATDYEVNATIWDESDNGGAGRWSSVENTVFDSTVPAFSSAVVASNGTTFTLTLDEAATQGAGYSDAHLTFSLSGGAVTAAYASGDGTTAHVYTMSRTVESGETGTVSFSGTDSLEDAVGNDVAFSGETVTNNSSGDITAPTVSTVTIATNGTDVTIVLDENGNVGAGGSGGFSAVMSGGTTSLTYASGDGTDTLVFNPARTIEAGETGTLSYAQPGNGIEDDAGNDLASFTGQALTNNSTADATAPVFQSAAIASGGGALTVTFDENVSQGAGYSDGDWAAAATDGALTFVYASGDGTSAHVLTPSRTIGSHEVVTLDWAGTANGLEDASGNDLAAFADEPVTNGSTADTVVPTIVSARITADVLTWTPSENLSVGAGGSGGGALTCSGGAITPTFVSAGGTVVFSLSRTPDPSETCTTAYTQPTDGLGDGTNDLATFSGLAVAIFNQSGCPGLTGATIGSVIGSVVQPLNCSR